MDYNFGANNCIKATLWVELSQHLKTHTILVEGQEKVGTAKPKMGGSLMGKDLHRLINEKKPQDNYEPKKKIRQQPVTQWHCLITSIKLNDGQPLRSGSPV